MAQQDSSRARRITYHNPVTGMTRGTKQGLIVIGLLLGILILFSLVSVGVSPWLGRTLDLVFGLCVAIAVTFVVGGTFSIEGRAYDFAIKAGGGAALIFAAIFWLQPYSSTKAPPKWPISVTFAPYMSLGEIIDMVNDERAKRVHSLRFEFQGDEQMIRQFRPIPPTTSRVYNGKTWDEIFKEFERDSNCFHAVLKGENMILLALEIPKTVEQRLLKEDETTASLRLCK